MFLLCSCGKYSEQEKTVYFPLSDSAIMDSVISEKNNVFDDVETLPDQITSLEKYFISKGLVNIQDLTPAIQVRLMYADTANFLHRVIYDSIKKAYAHPDVAKKLNKAWQILQQINPNLTIVVYDAARPQRVQKLLWDSVKIDSKLRVNYIARPENISLHNYGAAVDVSLLDIKNNLMLEMGTPVDFFGREAQPQFENEFLVKGVLTDTILKNRLMLRNIMLKAGLYPIHTEWWHFNSCNKDYAANYYTLLD